jgi:hypothetical protein
MKREDLLKAITNRETVELELSFGAVYVKPMTGGLWDRCVSMADRLKKDMSAKNNSDLRWFVIVNTLCERDGELLLNDDDRETFAAFNSKDRELIFEKALEISAASKEDKDFLADA